MGLTVRGGCFIDNCGRNVLLRGVNLGGDCKTPAQPDERTHLFADFSNHRTVSFVGRPFPLSDARSHFRRLAHWGFNCLRLLTTWEAVQHAGPGEEDEEYLDYFREICRIAGEFGFYVFIDFHQDVWSRMTGGSGAPGWTLEAAGIDIGSLDAADAAHVMQHRYDPSVGGYQDSYLPMSWASNYQAPANGVMWTLFWAGDLFATNIRLGGVDIKEFLQKNFLGAMLGIAKRVDDLDHVIGFDTLNEPGRGWIGRGLEHRPATARGPRWTVLDALAVAAGVTRKIPVDSGGTDPRCILVNERRVSIWRDGRIDPFRENGVWDMTASGEPVALVPDYFQRFGAPDDTLESKFILPFFHRVAETVRSVRPDWLIFAEISPHAVINFKEYPGPLPERSVNALHWYDYTALVNKKFTLEPTADILTGDVRTGRKMTRDYYVEQLSYIKKFGDRLPGGAPTLIGEFGIPFDLDEGASFRLWREGRRDNSVWSAQTEALELMYEAMDDLLISSVLWNYTASNRNDPAIGDGWNQEDLSIFSVDQIDDPDSPDAGARAIDGFRRPYVRRAQGGLLSQRYDRLSGTFECEIDVDLNIVDPTEIYFPVAVFGDDPELSCDPDTAVKGRRGQLIEIIAHQAGPLRVALRAPLASNSSAGGEEGSRSASPGIKRRFAKERLK